jgi:hypothetical protein
MRYESINWLKRRLAEWQRELVTNEYGFAYFAPEAISAIQQILDARIPQL